MLRQIVCYLIVLLILAPAASKISAQTAPSADPLEVDGSAPDTAPQVVAQSILDLTGNPELLEGSDRKIVLNPLHVQPVTTGEALQALRVGSGGAPAPASVRPASIDEGTSLRTSDAQGEHEVARVRQALIDGPFGIPDHYAVAGDQTLNVAGPGFLGNDIDLEGEALSATVIFDNVDNGSLAAFPSGTFSYTPDPGFTGTDSFQYRFRDASFNESDPVTVTIEVLDPANRTPLGATDDYSMIAGTTLSINAPGFLGNDIDLDGDDLSATVIFDNVDNGSLAAFPSGTFSYTPDPGFSGTDSFQYRFRDSEFNESDPVTVTIHVYEANRPPVGMEDAYATLLDTPLSIQGPGFLGNDVDLDGEALSATVIADDVDNGSLSAFPSGTFTYTPDQGFTGTDSFQYGFRDASFNSAGPVTVTILVIDPANETTPVGMPDHYAVAGDQTLSVAAPGFLGNDIDQNGEALSATVVFDDVDNGSLAAFPSGTFSYTPDPGFTGTDSFQYRFRDASFNESDPVTVTIEVLEPANRAPLGAPDAYSIIAGTSLAVSAPGFLGNDIDLDGDALSATVVFDNVDNGSLAAFPSGTFTYTPDPGFSGTDSFQYRLRDSEFNESEPVTVTIHVHEANRAPVGVEDAYATLMDTPLSIPAPGFLGNDVDLDGEALSATVIADNVDNGSLSAFPSGTFTYTPAQGFTGTDSFQYGFRDASFHNAGPVTVTILVIDPVDGVPDPPPAECTITTLAEGAPYKDSGINKIDITFTNPDGITQVEFSVLDNFVASSPGFIESDPANDIWTGGPLTTVEFTLAQDDPNLTSASYFAIASSVCPKETDGSFETDFDPFVHFPVEVPAKHELAQNFPNPFNPTTTISFALPEASTVRVTVHDALGREVRTLVDDVLGAGHHTAAWDGRDAAGSAAASGVYLYRIEAGDFVDVRQMILMK